jgi:hypothetical protein
MAFRDKNKVVVVAGDVVEANENLYRIKVIESYDLVTEVIAENMKTHKVETLLLRDVKKV